jgi:superfamily II DNA/RNA helicase
MEKLNQTGSSPTNESTDHSTTQS